MVVLWHVLQDLCCLLLSIYCQSFAGWNDQFSREICVPLSQYSEFAGLDPVNIIEMMHVHTVILN